MSTDPYAGSAHPTNPQSWNRYGYGLNDPMGVNDPSGWDDAACDTDCIDSLSGDGGGGDGGAGGQSGGGTDGGGSAAASYTSADVTGTDSEGNPVVGDPNSAGSVTVTASGSNGVVGAVLGSVATSPATASVIIPVLGPIGIQIGLNWLGPGNGSCLTLGLAATVGRSFGFGTYGGPLSAGNLSQSGSILGGWGGSASVVLGPLVGYQVSYGQSGVIGGLAGGSSGMSFSYGYGICH